MAKVSEAKRKANDTYDKENMAYQTIKVSKTLLNAFKDACKRSGDKVNTVLRLAMQSYVDAHKDE